ncbi:hypothetical protein [Cesiribacter sp. SM1]|uniref:hypothetical protein n=1 Tax=Cesiribacter sp. SM1 TaxID=2861196 RepID=UPI001CD5343A|nr:hypothetical protein [Cesiribacter sp. SM1]
MNRLKPAWQQFKLEQGLDQLEREAVLAIIDSPEPGRHRMNKITLINGLLLCFMMACCQGG